MSREPQSDKFGWGSGEVEVDSPLTGDAAEEMAALEKVWAARRELDAAEAEEEALNEEDDE